jgi:hypothetical protein
MSEEDQNPLPPYRPNNNMQAIWAWYEKEQTFFPQQSHRMRAHVNVVIAPPQDPMQGFSYARSSATAGLTIEPKVVERPSLAPEESQTILWTWIARLILSPSKYRSEWLPHIADMHFERFECLRRGDTRGARWAVVRAHVYSVPLRVWTILGALILWLVHHVHWMPI